MKRIHFSVKFLSTTHIHPTHVVCVCVFRSGRADNKGHKKWHFRKYVYIVHVHIQRERAREAERIDREPIVSAKDDIAARACAIQSAHARAAAQSEYISNN